VPDRVFDLRALERAVEAVPGRDLAASLHDVAAALPVAVSVEAVTIRLLDKGSERLHLLAAVGMPFGDVRRLSLEQMTIPQARTVLALGADHTLARTLGLVWLRGEWLAADGETVGLLTVGSRTARKPDDHELALLSATARGLAARLTAVDRSGAALRSASLALVRRLIARTPVPDDGVLGDLRPRERTILELYADGRSAREIAELLVISPHTVRTHLKLAFRRLGVHSREEATSLVHRDQLLTLL
jgi:DNA-binding CsgD family transcriptional regulator